MTPSQPNLETFPWNIWQEHLAVTRAHEAVGRPGRVLSARLLPGTEMVQGIFDLILKHEIRAGWVNGFGSLAKAHFSPGIRIRKSDPKLVERLPDLYLEGPLEMWSGQGKLGIGKDSQPFVHFHGIVSDQEDRMYGGHFFPDGTPIYATFELFIQEFLEIEHFVNQDEVLGIPLIEVKPK